jgi:hypothetical protein
MQMICLDWFKLAAWVEAQVIKRIAGIQDMVEETQEILMTCSRDFPTITWGI